MAKIRPFGALRFTEKAGAVEQLCCPPYDIVSEQQRLDYLAANEHNIIRLELPREGENPYVKATETLLDFENKGVLAVDDKPALYLYRESFEVEGESYFFTGIIAQVHLEEFSKGIILPHEETLSKAKEDRFNLMKATMCNFSQIYSLYPDEDGKIAAYLTGLTESEPEISFTDESEVTHSLWVVTDETACKAICDSFEERKLYIADGHHRYETALRFRDYLRAEGVANEGDASDYCMMALVAMNDPGLVVFPTHRVVRGLDSFDADEVAKACEGTFEVVELADDADTSAMLKEHYLAGDKSFVMYSGKRSWMMTLRDFSALNELCPDSSDALKGLDVTVLHTLVLERVLGIDKANMAAQINLTYTRDLAQAVELVDIGEANACFLMNPTKVEEIRAVASAGEKMPQKSTYFYPKLITGLVMNKLGEIE